MTIASIDWFRAAADIAGAFACTLVGQWWGYRQGYRAAKGEVLGALSMLVGPGHTPDRDDERLGL